MNARHPQTDRPATLIPPGACAALAVLAVALAGVAFCQEGPVRVTVQDEQAVVAEPTLSMPVDPKRRVNYQPQGLTVMVSGENGERLHLSHFPSLMLDGQFLPQQGLNGG